MRQRMLVLVCLTYGRFTEFRYNVSQVPPEVRAVAPGFLVAKTMMEALDGALKLGCTHCFAYDFYAASAFSGVYASLKSRRKLPIEKLVTWTMLHSAFPPRAEEYARSLGVFP